MMMRVTDCHELDQRIRPAGVARSICGHDTAMFRPHQQQRNLHPSDCSANVEAVTAEKALTVELHRITALGCAPDATLSNVRDEFRRYSSLIRHQAKSRFGDGQVRI